MSRKPRVTRSEIWWEKNNSAETGVFRCVWTMQDGNRCRSVAQDGVSCDKHGGEEGLEVTRRRHAQTLIGQAEWAMAEQKRLANSPNTDPAVKAKILDSMIDRAGLSAAQTHRIISAEQPDPIEKLFRAIAEDPNGLEPLREHPETAISEPPAPPALEAPPVSAAQPEPTPTPEPEPTPEPAPTTIRVVESSRTPRHIREAIDRMGRERRGFR